MHHTNATPQLPPLAVSDDVVVTPQTKEKPPLNAQDTAADSVNIDQFINDVDKKITEKTVEASTEGELSEPPNPNIPLDDSNSLKVEPIIGQQELSAPTQAPQQQNQPISPVDITKEQQAIPDTNAIVQPASNNALPSNNIQQAPPSENIPNITTGKNNPSTLLVPAYDSEQPKPEEPKVVLDNLPSQQQATAPDNFIINELQVALNLAPDEIEVGELTRDAYLDQVSFDEYCNILWQKHYEAQRAKQRKVIESFVNDYDKKFNQ